MSLVRYGSILMVMGGFVVAAAAVGCKKKPSDQSAGASDRAEADKQDRGESGSAGAGAPVDRGDFRVSYGRTEHRELANGLRSSKLLDQLASEFNDAIALPRDIEITVEDCGEPNAFYDRDTVRITLCYELIERFAKSFDDAMDSPDQAMEATLGATIFTLFHELGHALVHTLELPITGKEEDAVDQLAALVLIAGGEDGALMALDGAESFLLESQEDGPVDFDELPFWDEHSLDEQRFYSIICLVYGSNPDKYAEFVESGDLPEERAELCIEEFAQVERAWDVLLERHLKG